MDHQKIIRTPGNLARWEARHGVVIEQHCQKPGDYHIIVTKAVMSVSAPSAAQTLLGTGVNNTLLAVERVSTVLEGEDPEEQFTFDRNHARNDLAGKYNLWVEEMERERRIAEAREEMARRERSKTAMTE